MPMGTLDGPGERRHVQGCEGASLCVMGTAKQNQD